MNDFSSAVGGGAMHGLQLLLCAVAAIWLVGIPAAGAQSLVLNPGFHQCSTSMGSIYMFGGLDSGTPARQNAYWVDGRWNDSTIVSWGGFGLLQPPRKIEACSGSNSTKIRYLTSGSMPNATNVKAYGKLPMLNPNGLMACNVSSMTRSPWITPTANSAPMFFFIDSNLTRFAFPGWQASGYESDPVKVVDWTLGCNDVLTNVLASGDGCLGTNPPAAPSGPGWTCERNASIYPSPACYVPCNAGVPGTRWESTCDPITHTWMTVPGTGCSQSCTAQPGVINTGTAPWSCPLPTADGDPNPCIAACDAGWTGTASSALCTAGAWSVAPGACTPDCTAQPTTTPPGAAAWSCPLPTSSGSTMPCVATCATGWSGTASTALCTAGAWSVTPGVCQPDCTGQPAAVTGAAAWSCPVPTPSGDPNSCTAGCATGWSGSASTALCVAGAWSVTPGACTPDCTAQPTTTPPGAAAWSCPLPTSSGSTAPCVAACATGWSGTASTALCTAGAWSVTPGVCQPDCTGQPAAVTGAAAWSCPVPTPSGDPNSCTAGCATGWSGSASTALCVAGAWSVTPGACTPDCTAQPTTTPPGAAAWSCPLPTSSGSTMPCVATCATGWSGTASTALCTAGAWSVTPGVCQPDCTGQPAAVTGAAAWSCPVPTPSGDPNSCTAACATGWSGSASTALCVAGAWSVAPGACTPNCTAQPTTTPPGAAAWSCALPTASGDPAPCVTGCASGWSGTPSFATCSQQGSWTVASGVCEADCTLQPAVNPTGIVPWSCTLPARSGDLVPCTAACTLGWAGTPSSATCSSGFWAVTPGACTLEYCLAQPSISVPGGAPWNCSFPGVPSSSPPCTPGCTAGYSGASPSATCSSGVWTLTSTGSCAADCTSQPGVVVPGALAWACPVPLPSGALCPAACGGAGGGNVTALCSGGSWSVSGACPAQPIAPVCTTQPAPVAGNTWACSMPAADAGICQASCAPAFSGTGTYALCSAGAWSIVDAGACTADCTSQPGVVVPGALAWACPVPLPSGALCPAACGGAGGGNVAALCSGGSWSLSGACPAFMSAPAAVDCTASLVPVQPAATQCFGSAALSASFDYTTTANLPGSSVFAADGPASAICTTSPVALPSRPASGGATIRVVCTASVPFAPGAHTLRLAASYSGSPSCDAGTTRAVSATVTVAPPPAVSLVALPPAGAVCTGGQVPARFSYSLDAGASASALQLNPLVTSRPASVCAVNKQEALNASSGIISVACIGSQLKPSASPSIHLTLSAAQPGCAPASTSTFSTPPLRCCSAGTGAAYARLLIAGRSSACLKHLAPGFAFANKALRRAGLAHARHPECRAPVFARGFFNQGPGDAVMLAQPPPLAGAQANKHAPTCSTAAPIGNASMACSPSGASLSFALDMPHGGGGGASPGTSGLSRPFLMLSCADNPARTATKCPPTDVRWMAVSPASVNGFANATLKGPDGGLVSSLRFSVPLPRTVAAAPRLGCSCRTVWWALVSGGSHLLPPGSEC